MNDIITILTCKSPNACATKSFLKHDDGQIQKQSYYAGKVFDYETKEVTCLEDIQALLESLKGEIQKFIIRGKSKLAVAGEDVYRRSRDANAIFEASPHHWVAFDIDKKPYPNEMNVAENPQEVIKWLKEQLPDCFHDADCVYKFSSSQNVPDENGKIHHTVSVHLYFWCDRKICDKEWKTFIKDNSYFADIALFNPVQPHYTAEPLFSGLENPLKERLGVC